jgi:hypothetical protein
MIVMLSNNTGYTVKELYKKHDSKMALLLNPHRIYSSLFNFRYAIDNAAFNRFNEPKFFELLEYSKDYQPPMFVAVPDVVGCHYRTLALWNHYEPKLRRYSYPLAFVAQDGCTPEFVPNSADWIFIGGNDPWKMDNAHKFIGSRPVHVGRVNGIGRLKYCESIGVTSVDGTGWLRARGKQFNDIMEYFNGQKQRELWPADQK